jgi:hypothetical protein
LYIPLAIHKNELVEIGNMETFSHYFCLTKKQKMTPLATHAAMARQEEEADDEEKTYFEDGAIEIADEDEEL